MIYIFKTSVLTEKDIQSLKPYLDKFPQIQWNFDLEDCDKILRIESLLEMSDKTVIEVLQTRGFICELLPY